MYTQNMYLDVRAAKNTIAATGPMWMFDCLLLNTCYPRLRLPIIV